MYKADKIIYNGKQNPVFVSITSWKQRIQYLPLMINYLKKLTIQPDKVIIWLSSDELSKNDIPNSLLSDSFVDIKWVDKNLYVWKRFLTIQLFPNASVLMMDDDFYYHPTYIEEMLKCADEHNNKGIICYSCNWCNSNGEPWGGVQLNNNVHKYWISGGVTLWCPNSFPYESLELYEKIMSQYDLLCDECYLMPFIYYHKTPIYTIEDDWKTFFKKTLKIQGSLDTALHEAFFERPNDFGTNKKNILLRRVVSSLPLKYRESFKLEFYDFTPIEELFPEKENQ